MTAQCISNIAGIETSLEAVLPCEVSAYKARMANYRVHQLLLEPVRSVVTRPRWPRPVLKRVWTDLEHLLLEQLANVERKWRAYNRFFASI